MADPTLLITLIIVILSALVGAYLNGKRRDRCLEHFERDPVNVELLGGRQIWGRLHVEPTGIELIYASDHRDVQEHIETTYLLYKDEFPQIQAIYRYCDAMDEDELQRRQAMIDKVFHPRPGARLRRRLRNFISLASDSLAQAIGVIVGSSKARGSKFVTEESQEYFTSLGSNLIGYAGTEYDPLLERYVGVKVVVELTEGDTVYEHVGILRDYTADFLEMLDIHFPITQKHPLATPGAGLETPFLRANRSGKSLYLANAGKNSLLLQTVTAAEQEMSINAVLDADEDLALELPPALAGADIELNIKIVRQLDFIIPRARALIRHKAERYDPDQVFDIGFGLKSDYTTEEKKLHAALDDNPDDANSAVVLGQLLFKRGRLQEAERWFNYALARRQQLTDQGKLAERQLRYIKLKRSGFYR